MKQIIKNKLYDTETAVLVFSNTSTLDEYSDFTTEWYRKQNGEFFTIGNCVEVLPRTEDRARNFLGQVCSEQYEKLFGPVSE